MLKTINLTMEESNFLREKIKIFIKQGKRSNIESLYQYIPNRVKKKIDLFKDE